MILLTASQITAVDGRRTSYVLRIERDMRWPSQGIAWLQCQEIVCEGRYVESCITNNVLVDHCASFLHVESRTLGAVLAWHILFTKAQDMYSQSSFVDPVSWYRLVNVGSSPGYDHFAAVAEKVGTWVAQDDFILQHNFLGGTAYTPGGFGYHTTTISPLLAYAMAAIPSINVFDIQKTFKKLSKSFQKTFTNLLEIAWRINSKKLFEELIHGQ
jgi:hypothetical protein